MKNTGIIARLFGRTQATVPTGNILGAIANRPMLMAPRALDTMLASASSMPAREGYREDGDWSPQGSKPEHLIEVSGDIGILSVSGPLFHQWSIEAWWWGGTGYDMIVAAHRMLLADERVKSIVHVYDSPGGQVNGCFDAVDVIFASRGQKPITAVINDDAFSAAYALASAADRIVISRTGGAGSIGVRATHIDVSGWDAAVGLKYTTVVDGDKKADYDIHAPLSDRAQGELQAEVDRLGVIFRDTVARNRGLAADAIKAQQAGAYYGDGAIAAGLADEIGTLDDTLIAMVPKPDNESDPIEGEPVDPDAAAAGDAKTAKVTIAGEVIGSADDLAEKLANLVKAGIDGMADSAAAAVTPPVPDAASFASEVAKSELPADLAVALIKRGARDQTPEAAIAYASTLRDLAFAAGDESLAIEFVNSNTPIETARSQLIALKAEDGPEVVTLIPASDAENAAARRAASLNPQTIYQQRGK